MDNKTKLNAIVNRLVSATDPDEVKRSYKEWADTYDSDLDSFGYVAPRIGVKILADRLTDTSALIHDAGCGTGLVGSLLNKLGYKHLHGSDFSTSMLEKAAHTGHYNDLSIKDYSGPIDIASDSCNAVISIGVYTKRFNQHFIAEMVRITRPAGFFVFSCRDLYISEVMQSISSLLAANTISSATIKHDEYMIGQNASAYYLCIEK